MKYCLVLLGLVSYILSCEAQSGKVASTNLLGSQFKYYTFKNLINYTKPSVNAKEFRGKILIVDYWSTGCAACIVAWPRLLEIQNEFKKDVQIILVNPWESKSTIIKTINRRKEVAGVNMILPVSCGDKELLKLLKIEGIPFVAWVNAKGQLSTITGGEELTSDNIEHILKEKAWNLKPYIRNSDWDKFTADIKKPLFVNNNGGFIDTVYWQSILTKSKDSLLPTFDFRSDTYGCWVHCAKCTITDLYRMAYSNRFERPGKMDRLILSTIKEETDSNTLVSGAVVDTGYEKQRYIYHLTCPRSPIENLQLWFQEDLKRYFRYSARWEKRKVLCLILKASDTSLIAYKSGPPEKQMTIFMMHFNKEKVSYLVERLAVGVLTRSPYPLIDETGFKGLLGDIEMDTDLTDISKIDDALKKYKMSLTLEEREIEILVLRK